MPARQNAEAVAYRHLHDVIAARAERDPNPDLGCAARDAIRHGATDNEC